MKDYLTLKAWEDDLKETVNDFRDLSTIVKRQFIRSSDKFKYLTSREIERMSFAAGALWFSSEKEFDLYATTHKWPLGPCLIYDGKKTIRFDDTKLFNGGK
ncbi:MAG TPA: hypothetical protein VJB94_01015 [Candidatus Nanoarchaeia archaeon]|nr:hypothetical protein [Candidatus Nanoarchaeia archaeon]